MKVINNTYMDRGTYPRRGFLKSIRLILRDFQEVLVGGRLRWLTHYRYVQLVKLTNYLTKTIKPDGKGKRLRVKQGKFYQFRIL